MNRILLYIFYTSLFLGMCVEKTQTAKKNTPFKDASQLNAWNRASRQGFYNEGHGYDDDEADEVPQPSSTEPDKNNCSCSKIYDPVCASTGRSYYNLCQMECDTGVDGNVTVVHQGNCIPF